MGKELFAFLVLQIAGGIDWGLQGKVLTPLAELLSNLRSIATAIKRFQSDPQLIR